MGPSNTFQEASQEATQEASQEATQETSQEEQQQRSQSNRRRSRTKERSQPTLWGIAAVSFVLGSAATTLTIWQLHKLYRATVAPVIAVEGTLRAQYDYDKTNPVRPDPTGYYIESAGTGRIYLTGTPLNSYVGKPVSTQGSVSGICGPKSIPCYPLIEVRQVRYAEAAK